MPESIDCILQAAALPLRDGRLCLVTSSSGKRWIIPKGIIEPGQTPAESATVEAWEEAGLTGSVRPAPVGEYRIEKWGKTCRVTVYVLDVVEEHAEWPERAVRRRRWFDAGPAIQRLHVPDLRRIAIDALLAAPL